MLISVVIPSWNGERLLRKNLPKVLKALPKGAELIVVDDGSTDNSVEYVRELTRSPVSALRVTRSTTRNPLTRNSLTRNPQTQLTIKLIENKKNRGFIYSCNRGVKEAKGEFVVLLNNDVIPQKGFLEPALKHFNNPKVFAVCFNETQDEWGSWARIFWQLGFFNYLPGKETNKPHISGWASGGSAVFRKSMWKKLKGFDKIYEPFYWEDLDLSYRAWKRGWKIIWEPKAKVEHHHASTISRLDRRYVDLIKERNQLLFIWKNIDDFGLRLSHLFGLLLRVLTGPNYLKVILAAWKQYRYFGGPKEKKGVRSDREILRLFKS